jgi:hypothetical protein
MTRDEIIASNLSEVEKANERIKMLEDKLASIKQAIAELESQEPVAWVHTKIDGVAVTHRPADLDKHPDRWTALYKDPKPCPTCEALARTVMLDQTSHDTHPPQRTWVGLTDEEAQWLYDNCRTPSNLIDMVEAKLKDKNT